VSVAEVVRRAIVSRYIAETEKNLNRIFGAACPADGILLFDEADALFGRRREAKNARDHNAKSRSRTRRR
jgi:SpoVK/Ycf46/Vps4 family AAA+-type ATPase